MPASATSDAGRRLAFYEVPDDRNYGDDQEEVNQSSDQREEKESTAAG